MRKKEVVTEEQWINAIKNNISFASVLRSLDLYPGGSNYDKLKRIIKHHNLDISHMTGQGWNVGDNYRNFHPITPIERILVKDSPYVNSRNIKERLFKENLKQKVCERCGLSIWMDNPIPLELHHINGIKDDLRLENLQILCPNCHAMTDNYRGKNIKR